MKQKQGRETAEALVQNLKDAGCKPEQVEQFLMLRDRKGPKRTVANKKK